jgi:hypothetical protein
MTAIALRVLACEFTIHRLPPDAPLPPVVVDAPFCWIGRTDDELSIVCDADLHLTHGRHSVGWACLQVVGPLDFGLTGILAGIADVLAAAHISIFALSTFDTDYILVKQDRLDEAVAALRAADYDVG